jgi:branched-chain amino acid transport system ATP-binding protein
MPLLEIKEMSAQYGKIQAVRQISFSVEAGEFVTIIGANGAGKSTTLRTLSGIMKPSAGRIRFAGEDITGLPSHAVVKRGMSHVPEGRQVFTRMTVRENLEMGAFLDPDPQRLAANLNKSFEMFPRLAERESQKAGTLSGGEQQMLAMARGLMSHPKLLLLDEPSMGLAPKLVAQIFEVVAEINRMGCTILLVEQNANMALQVASRAFVLESGSIVLEGPAEELRQDERVRKAYLGIE